MRDRFEREAADLLAVLDDPRNSAVFTSSRGAGDTFEQMLRNREARRALRG